MRTWIISSILLLTASLSWAKPRNPLPQTPDQIWQNDLDLLQDINTGLEEVAVSSSNLPSGSTQYIQNTNTLQSGAVFYVSSGTVGGFYSPYGSQATFSQNGGADNFVAFIDTVNFQAGYIGQTSAAGSNTLKISVNRTNSGSSIQTGQAGADILLNSSNGDGSVTIRATNTNNSGPSTVALFSGSGEITQPLQPSFLVTQANSQLNETGDGTSFITTWTTEVYDQGGDFSSSTFTAPVSGRYLLCLGLRLGGILNTHTDRTVRIVTSNRNYVVNQSYALAETTYGVSFCAVADMDANDTAATQVQFDGSTKVVDIVGSAVTNFFSGSLIN